MQSKGLAVQSLPEMAEIRAKLCQVSGHACSGGAGAGVGAGIGAATYHPCSSQSFCLDIGGRALPTAIGAAIGFVGVAVAGALLPSHKTIYRVNSQQLASDH